MKPIVVCSGEINRYGYRNVPEGGRLDAYLKNPVLLWNHDHGKKSVGKATQLGIVDGKLQFVPEFDESDEDALELKRKYEHGYLNAVSMDHIPITTSSDPEDLLPGQTRVTVKEWELLEISCVNVPGDRGAITLNHIEQQLDKMIPKLPLNIDSQSQNSNVMSFEKISKALGLSADATEGAIVDEITKLSNRVKAVEDSRTEMLVEAGKAAGVINDENEDAYRKLSAADYDNAAKLVKLSAKKAESKEPETQLTAKTLIDTLKGLTGGGKKDDAGEEETFEKLSKTNPSKLNEIRRKDPERYAKMATDYAATQN